MKKLGLQHQRIGVALVLAAVAGPAGAPALARAADAEALLREGVELRRTGDDARALNRFQEAYAVDKSPRALAQMGFAEQALGRWGAADRHLRDALQAGGDPWIKKNRKAIEKSLEIIDARVGQIDVRGTPAGAEVSIDGEVVGQLPLPKPVRVTAGGVVIEVRAPGHFPIARTANVGAKALARESFDLQPLSRAQGQQQQLPPPQPPPPPPDRPVAGKGTGVPAADAAGEGAGARPVVGEGGDAVPPLGSDAAAGRAGTGAAADQGSGRRILAIGAAGLSLAALGLGIVQHVSWQDKVASFDGMPQCGASLPARGGGTCTELYDDGQRARLIAFVGYGAALAFGAAAAVIYFTDPARGSAQRQVACAPGFHGAGVGCALRF